MRNRARSTSWPMGKEPGRNPYFSHLYRVGLDGQGLKLLTPEDANHQVTLLALRRATLWIAIRSPTFRP